MRVARDSDDGGDDFVDEIEEVIDNERDENAEGDADAGEAADAVIFS